MTPFEFSLLGALISGASALGAEVIRVQQASRRLAADMQDRVLKGGDPLPERTVRYPRGYFVTALIYALVAAAAGGAAGSSVPWPVYVYVGFSLPAVIARVVQTAEPLFPGRLTVDGLPAKGDHPTVDNISSAAAGRSLRRVRPGVFRAANSLYNYLVG